MQEKNDGSNSSSSSSKALARKMASDRHSSVEQGNGVPQAPLSSGYDTEVDPALHHAGDDAVAAAFPGDSGQAGGANCHVYTNGDDAQMDGRRPLSLENESNAVMPNSNELQELEDEHGAREHVHQHLYENLPGFGTNTGEQGLASTSRLDAPTPPNRSLAHHTKRRKINTCLPCKRRKVKCDREKPYCGQCKKSQIPAEECTWSAAVDHPASRQQQHPPNANFSAPIAAAAAAADVAAHAENGADQWYDSGTVPWAQSNMSSPAVSSPHALMERIAALEAELADAQGRNEAASTAVEDKPDDDLVSSGLEADRVMAADALATVSQDQPTAERIPDATSLHPEESGLSRLKYHRLFDHGANVRPECDAWLSFTTATPTRIQDLVRILPDRKIIVALLQQLEIIQTLGICLGATPRLIELQVETEFQDLHLVFSDLARVNLSLLAVLYYALAVAADLAPLELLQSVELVDSEDGVRDVIDTWSKAGHSALQMVHAEGLSNINIIAALSLQRQLHSSQGKIFNASLSLAAASRHSCASSIGLFCHEGEDETIGISTSIVEKEIRALGPNVLLTYTPSSDKVPNEDLWKVSEDRRARTSLVRSAGCRLYNHLLQQEFMEDPFMGAHSPDQDFMALPLRLRTKSSKDEEARDEAADDEEETPGYAATRLIYTYAHLFRFCRQSDKSANAVADTIARIDEVPQPKSLQGDAIAAEDPSKQHSQKRRSLVNLYQQYTLFCVSRNDESQVELCVEAARLVIQNRLGLIGSPAQIHRLFALQSFALQCALLLVVYLHQYSSQVTEERKQQLQEAINDLYAEPGYEHASALLSLSLDSSEPALTSSEQVVNGAQVALPDSDLSNHDDPTTTPQIVEEGLTKGGDLEVNRSGMTTKGGILSCSHPIVIGLRGFLLGNLSPFGTCRETLEFWTALERHASLFLSTS